MKVNNNIAHRKVGTNLGGLIMDTIIADKLIDIIRINNVVWYMYNTNQGVVYTTEALKVHKKENVMSTLHSNSTFKEIFEQTLRDQVSPASL